MEQVRFNHSSQPATSAPSAAGEQMFDAAMRSGSALPLGGSIDLQGERLVLDGLVRDLGGEIQGLLAQFGRLQAAAGWAEAAQSREINALLTQIAGLSRSIDLAQARSTPEYRLALGAMQALYNRLAGERAVGHTGSAAAGEALAGLRAAEGGVKAALAQILQQLSSLQMRMGALGALI